MKELVKGFNIQLCINLFAHLIRIIIAYLIVKYAQEPQLPTSFSKDSSWQIISLFTIVIYNIVSLIIVVIIKFRKDNIKTLISFCIASILGIIYSLNVLRNLIFINTYTRKGYIIWKK